MGPLLGAWAANTFVKELTIEGVSGSLLSRIDVDKVEWRSGDVTTLNKISLEPGRPDFSTNLLPIEALSVESLIIDLAATDNPRKRGELVDIGDFGTSPVNLLIESGKLAQFIVKEQDENLFQLDDVVLDGTAVTDDKLLLKDVSADMQMEPNAISLTISEATMDMLAPHEINLKASFDWQHPDIGDIKGALVADGLLQSYVLNADGDILHSELGTQSFGLEAKGDFDFLDIEVLTLGGDSGSLKADGEIAWVPNLSVDLDLIASNLKTAQFVPEWPADLTGELSLKASEQNGKLRGGLDIESLNGTLRGYPLTGSGQVSMLNDELIFDQLEFKSSNNVLKVDGRGSEPFDLNWDIRGNDLSSIAPGLAGRVSARGALTGTMDLPIINGKLDTTRLSFQGNKLNAGNLEIKTVDGQFQVDGRLQGLTVNGERVRNATLSGKGDVDKHSLSITADHTQAKVSAAVDGEWDGQRWSGTLQDVNINDRTFGQWALKQPANVTVSTAGVVADELCLVGADGSACSALNYTQQDGFSTQGQLVNAPLQVLNPLIPAGITVNGRVGGDYAVTLNPDLKGRAELNFSAGEVNVSQDGKTQRIAYTGGVLKADVNGNDIKAETRFNLVGDGLINAKADLQLSPDDGKHQIDAEGEFKSIPLALGQKFLPPEIGLSGLASGSFSAKQIGDDRSGKLLLNSRNMDFVYSDQTAGPQRYQFNQVNVDATLQGDQLQADTQLSLVTGGSLDARATVDLSQPDIMKSVVAEGEVKSMPLALARPYLPSEFDMGGLVSGEFNIRQDAGVPVGQVDLVASNGFFDYKPEGERAQQYAYNAAKIQANIRGDDIDGNVDLDLKNGGRLNASATVDLSNPDLTKSIAAEGKLEAVPLAMVRPYLPKEFDLDGTVSGNFKVQQEGGQPVGEVDLLASNGFFKYQPSGEQAQQYAYNSAKIQGSIRGDNIDGNVDFDLKDGGRFNGRATVDLSNPDMMKAVNAEGKIESMPLALLRPYLPKEIDVDGLISGEYSVSQQAGEPVGRVNLISNGGRFSYKEEGAAEQRYQYRTAQVQATVQGDKLLADVGLELSDGGILNTKSSADISSFDKDPIFTAQGTVRDMPMALAKAYLPEGLVLNGRINGEYDVEQNGKLKGKVKLTLPASSLSYDDGTNPAQSYRYRSAEVIADIDGDKVATDIKFALMDGGSFSTKGRLDLSQANNLFAFEGEGSFDAFPLSLAQPYLPVPMTFKGVAQGSYQLSQTGGQQGKLQLTLPASSFTIDTGDGETQTFEYETSQLNATVNGKSIVADTRIALKDGGVIDGNANIVLGASAASHRINVEGKLVSVPLALLEPYVSEDFAFPGQVNGTYKLSQNGGKLAGNVNLSLPNSYFVIETASGDKKAFAYEQGILNTTIDGDRINVDSNLTFKGKGDMSARAQIVLRENGEPSINGVAEVDIPNIYWAQPYVPYSRGLRGKVVGKVSFAGIVSKPRVTGQISMSDGYLRLPQVGTELSDINLSIQANQANQATIVGSINSGGGVIKANGSLSINDVKNWTAKLSLTGDNIKFVDTHEATAYMSPNLQIDANPQAVVIRGTIDIPTADINLKDLPEFSIDESEDVIVIGERAPGESITAVRLQPNIQVRLGNNVRFKGFGFRTRLVGGVRVTNSRNTIVTNGSMYILEGRYEAYGQDLKIDNGRLVFNGPPKNVGVDVRAIREVDSGEVGIHLTGTMQKLKSSIFSDPVMQETEALSYLITGQSLTSATGRETALLMQAVRGLGIDGSEGLISRLGKSLGLDDLSIVTQEDFRESELQLGKKLGSKLYVRYLVGLFDSAHRIAVDYKINKYLNIEAQVGEEQSLDLIYEYEKD
ncbi:hypothetical protein DKW60_03435 [Leucothrix pacifica]|uniref:Translocation and assembly module TamB C-terminal domain-containing protein n=1 Tax=Leucothrix pacifica TaxID=1247513 RepID=A0A317CRN7_9GAMM|nr:hypothetical protein DKW60_03435 [Leucothrix pacifica]